MKLRKLQITRRFVQIVSLVLMLAIPAIARYTNYLSARELDENMEKWQGSLQGHILSGIDSGFRALPNGEKERVGRIIRDRKGVLADAQSFRGGPWSVKLGRITMTDPLAGAESIVASKKFNKTLMISLLIPILASMLLGRVFCSWVCPMNLLLEMTDKLRRVLGFLEITPQDVHFSRSTKYILLGVGLSLTAFLAVPVLGYIYPPAIINREAHDFIFGIFDRAEINTYGLWFGGLTWMSLIIGGIVLFEVLVSRRWWCRHVCPGGALYSLLGYSRPVRVVLDKPACTFCTDCVEVCPVGLNPMKNEMGIECDNCGVCISHCDDKALSYKIVLLPEKKGSEK